MIVLDAYAVLAYLKREPAAVEVARMLMIEHGALSALGVAEVVDHLVRRVGIDAEEAILDLAELGLLDTLVVDDAVGLNAGLLRSRHYHRRDRAVSLADCVAAEVAQRREAPLVSADPHLLDMCHSEGIRVHRLPASDGSLSSPNL